MKKKLVLNTILSLLLQVTTVICGFILPRQMLEYYGSDVNGLVQSIARFLSIVSFLELGVGQVIQSGLYKSLSVGDMDSVSKVLKSGTDYFRKIAFTMLGYILILVLLSPYIFEEKYGWTYTAMLILAMGISSFAQYYFGLIDSILLSADQNGYVQFAIKIILNIFNVVIVMHLIRQGNTIQMVKIASAAIFLFGPIMIRWYINRNYKIDRKIVYTEEPIKQKWNGIAQHIATVVLEGTDVIILTVFSTLTNVSIYSVYSMVIAGVRQLYNSATAGIQSMIGGLWASGENDRLESVFQVIEIILHLTVVFLFSCVAVLIVPFIEVYTFGITDCDYIQPIFALILTVAYAIRCLRTPYNILVLAAGHYKQTQSCHIIAAIMNIVISIIAVLYWGLIGIAIGTLLAFAYQTVWMMVYTSKKILKRSMYKVLKQVLIDVLAVVLVYVSTMWISMSGFGYLGWFVMAVKVAGIAFFVIAVMVLLFYSSQVKKIYHKLKR